MLRYRRGAFTAAIGITTYTILVGAILLWEWQDFRVILLLGADFTDLDSLGIGRDIGCSRPR